MSDKVPDASATPRTDEAEIQSNIQNQADTDWPWSAIKRGWDFARTLERMLRSAQGTARFYEGYALRCRDRWERQRGGQAYTDMQQELARTRQESERLTKKLAAAKETDERFQKCFSEIAKAAGISSPLELIANALDNQETYAETLVRVVGQKFDALNAKYRAVDDRLIQAHAEIAGLKIGAIDARKQHSEELAAAADELADMKVALEMARNRADTLCTQLDAARTKWEEESAKVMQAELLLEELQDKLAAARGGSV